LQKKCRVTESVLNVLLACIYTASTFAFVKSRTNCSNSSNIILGSKPSDAVNDTTVVMPIQASKCAGDSFWAIGIYAVNMGKFCSQLLRKNLSFNCVTKSSFLWFL